MTLKSVQKAYEKVGEEDPLWAILTNNSKRGGKWDPNDFFDSGVKEIDGVMEYIDTLDIVLKKDNAFDFGCGVGRLTQALCNYFDNVSGMDISKTMIKNADKFNKFGDRCNYITNTEPNLRHFKKDTLDFVYTRIVLQHMAPRYQVEYIKEFFRVLKPGGIALFQVRAKKSLNFGFLTDKVYALNNEYWKPFWKKLRSKPSIQVHTISPEVVEQVIKESGMKLIDVQNIDIRVRKSRKSLRYCVEKPQ